MRRRRLPFTVLVVIAGVLGAGIAFLVAGPMLAGHTKELLFVIAGGVGLVAALSSLEVAMIGLVTISYVDGFLKGLIVSPITVFAKDIVLAAGLIRWFWLGLTRQRWEALRLPVILPARAHIERMLVTIVLLSLVTGIYAIVQYNIGFEHLYALSPGFSFYNRFTWGSGVRAVATFVAPGALLYWSGTLYTR